MLFSNQYYLFDVDHLPSYSFEYEPCLKYMAKQFKLNSSSIFMIASFLYFITKITESGLYRKQNLSTTEQ